MSGVAHAIGKVFKGVVGIVKKIWKPLAIAAAVYFTGGLAAGAFAGAGAAGGAAAFAGATADAVGGAAALGDVAATAAAGTGALEAAGGAGALAGDATAGAAAGGTFGDAVASNLGLDTAADTGTSIASDLGAGAYNDAAGSIAEGAPNLSPGDINATGAGQIPASEAQVPGAGTSSLWDSAKGVAGGVMKNPMLMNGLLGLGSGLLNSYSQQQMLKQQEAWAEAHAPGNVAGGMGTPFAGWKSNQNLFVTPEAGHKGNTALAGGPNLAITAQPAQAQVRPLPAPGPYYDGSGLMNYSSVIGGGTPYPGGTVPGASGNQPWYPTGGPGGLMGSTAPFMDNPYNEEGYYG